jgi:hypothetical protein
LHNEVLWKFYKFISTEERDRYKLNLVIGQLRLFGMLVPFSLSLSLSAFELGQFIGHKDRI